MCPRVRIHDLITFKSSIRCPTTRLDAAVKTEGRLRPLPGLHMIRDHEPTQEGVHHRSDGSIDAGVLLDEASSPRTLSSTSRIEQSRLLSWSLMALAFGALAILSMRGWYPHDEGTLGQPASRVLMGETPHVDFYDTYSGLQAHIHALAFRFLGESIRTLRIVSLGVAAILGLSAYAVMRRRVAPLTAALGVVAILIGPYAAYPAAMPSWWNVALGFVAILLLLRYRDSERMMYVVAAGAVTGMSFLIKSTAVYVAAALLLWLTRRVARLTGDRRLLGILCIVTTAFFVVLVSQTPSLDAAVLLVIPWGVFCWACWSTVELPGEKVSIAAWKPGLVFLGSFAFPPFAFAGRYVASGDLGDLIDGWFVLPRLRFDLASIPLDVSPRGLVLLAALGGGYWFLRGRFQRKLVVAFGLMSGVAVGLAAWQAYWFLSVLMVALILMVVLGPLVTSFVLARRSEERSEVWLLAAFLIGFAFVQFPTAGPVYASFLTPIAISVVVVMVSGSVYARTVPVVLAVAALVIGIQVAGGHVFLGAPVVVGIEYVPLTVSRGGIQIPREHDFYNQMAEHLARYEGVPIYAGPDAPEVYFLSGALNPSGALFELLDPEWDPGGLPDFLRRSGAQAVVINLKPDFSPEISPEILASIREDYPVATQYGRFAVYERSGSE